MSTVSSYILSIAGVILISVIVELVMSEGQMNKYIKSIFAFFTVAVIISPLPSILSTQNVSSIFDIEDFELQEGYLNSLNQSKAEVLSNELELLLKNDGYENVIITINFAGEEIEKVNVNLINLVISEKAKHKDINEIRTYISDTIIDKLNVEGGKIVYET